MPFLSFFARSPPAGSLLLACLNQSPARRVVGGAGGDDDSVAGIVACLLARGRFSDTASSVSSRRAWRGAGRIRPLLFRRDDLSRVCLVVPSLGGAVHFLGVLLRGVVPIVSPSYLLAYHCPSRPSSRFSSRRASRCACLAIDVFFLCFFSSFAGVLSPLDLSPRSSRSVVSSSRLVLRLVSGGGPSCACSIAPIAFSSRPCRLVGRDGERSEIR